MNGIKCTSTGTCKGTHNHETPNPFEHMKNVRQSYLQTETFDFSVPYVFVYIERIKFDSNAPLHHLSLFWNTKRWKRITTTKYWTE